MSSSSARLPSGVVTFLLTDIEGSTARWEAEPELMTAALVRHDEVVREAIEAWGGTLVKSKGEGDSTFSVFEAADAAASAAMAIHVALEAAGPLRVRIGMHTGEAVERDGDYFGPTVNRAARLRAAAHGGQTICSSLTGRLVLEGDRSIALFDLGEHGLKDLARADRIIQIGAGDFPPLRTAPARRDNLPTHPTEFVGRARDVEAVAGLLDHDRLVVLTGVGGVGKTRLSLEVAASFFDRAPDGAYFVDLAPVSDPSLLASTIANVLPFAPTSGDIAGELVAFLAERHVLVVLDNCEHLVDACADLLGRVLSSGGAGRVLATSREPFGIAGERDWQVGSLDAAESSELFALRAAAVRSSFTVDETNEGVVTEICQRLDGVPLAIELAAARVAHLHPEQIARRLNDRFTLLAGGRGRVQRHETLEAALDWSYDLLEPAEQVLLRRLSVFNGSFTLEAVEGICSDQWLDPSDILDVLAALVRQSLVDVRDDGRYRLLETVRLYAERRLAEARENEARRDRHLDWYLDLVEAPATAGGRASDAVARLELDHDNVSVAVSWAVARQRVPLAGRIAVATAPMWMYGRHTQEAWRWLAPVLADRDVLEPELLVACLAGQAYNSSMLLADDAFDLAKQATLVPGAPATSQLGYCRAALAVLASVIAVGAPVDPSQGPTVDEAIGSARSTLHEARESSRPLDIWYAEALEVCGEALLVLGRFAESADLARDSLAAAEVVGLDPFTANVRRLLIVALHLDGDHGRAMEETVRVLADATAGLGSYEAVVLAAEGDIDFARQRAAENLTWAAELGHLPLHDVDTLITIAAIEAIAGDDERAATLLAAGRSLGKHYSFGGFRSPMSFALYVHYVRLVRAALDPDDARRARDRGLAMSLEEAIGYALSSDRT